MVFLPFCIVVCTSQFIVMFTGGDGSGKSKCSCYAYISQSTRGFRSLLREHVSRISITHYDLCSLS